MKGEEELEKQEGSEKPPANGRNEREKEEVGRRLREAVERAKAQRAAGEKTEAAAKQEEAITQELVIAGKMPKAKHELQLVDRDRQMMGVLATVRYLAMEQLRRLFFAVVWARTPKGGRAQQSKNKTANAYRVAGPIEALPEWACKVGAS